MIYLYPLAAIWAACGAAGYAICFAYFQRRWPQLANEEYRLDLAFAVFIGLSGPIGLLVTTFQSEFAKYGLKWR